MAEVPQVYQGSPSYNRRLDTRLLQHQIMGRISEIEEEMMNLGYIVGLIGIWFVQDALASIAFYPKEKWRWNHTARLVRAGMGIVLVILGGLLK